MTARHWDFGATRIWLGSLGLLLLAACTPQTDIRVTKADTSLDGLNLSGPLLQFPNGTGLAVQRPNGQIAQDFMDLEFHLESGLALPVLTRFDGPISIAMTGTVPPTARTDLAHLIARLRAEAGISLTLLPDQSSATLTVAFERKAVLRRIEPTAACFVVPNVSSLQEYRRLAGSAALDWRNLRQRSRATLFVPDDSSPQEVRDCLNEETAQALGPVNDLFRLPDSVFNDDNFQSVLTGFDMLMLRLHYAPDFASGMGEAEVAARLPAVLARLNPRGAYGGASGGTWGDPDTPRVWLDAVSNAMDSGATYSQRLRASDRALSIALGQGWQDNRLGFAHYIRARMESAQGPANGTAIAAAEVDYSEAARIFASLPDEGVHLGHALMQLAAIDLAKGQLDQAIALADQALPLAAVAQNASLLATLKLIKAEALDLQGHHAAATALRLDSLPAARYGFGAEPEVRARAAEIAAIAHLSPPG